MARQLVGPSRARWKLLARHLAMTASSVAALQKQALSELASVSRLLPVGDPVLAPAFALRRACREHH